MTQDAATFGSGALTVVGTLGASSRHATTPGPGARREGDSDPQEAICKLGAYAARVVARARVALAAAKPLDGKPRSLRRPT